MRMILDWFYTAVRGMAMIALVGVAGPALANNIAVTNVALRQQDTGANAVKVRFDLSWDNSWKGSENWDAAWVFVKFRAPGSNNWQHAILSTNSADHNPAANSTIAAVPDGTGVLVYRSSGYTGSVNYAKVELQWNYGSNGYNFVKGALVEVSVNAIEMVYVPQGQFCLGSGGTGTETSPFYQSPTTTNAYLVTNENAIVIGSSAGQLYYASSSFGGDQLGIVSNVFPKGYNAFYCMKYEITQGQWVDFFNKLTAPQKTNLDITSNVNGGKNSDNEISRNTVSWTNAGDATCTAPDRACDYLSWADGCAYAAWACFRPMTELEFEKACRGSALPVANEYGWGSTTLTNLAFPETGSPGSGTETPNPATANCTYANIMGGPTRVGIFARAGSSRQSAGASYWGIMELSGNLWERCVTVGSAHGRAFTGSLGSGVLDVNGNATNSDWYASDASGGGSRGGTWGLNAAAYMCVSDRTFAARVDAARGNLNGWRGVRQAP